MSSPLAQPGQSGGFTLPTSSTRAGVDPDGVVDNRPGVAHPSLSRTKAKSVRESQHGYRDHFARASNNSSERVNQTSETTRDTSRHQDLMVGVGLRTPKPVGKKHLKRRKKRSSSTVEDSWGDEFTWTDDSLEFAPSLNEKNSEG